MITGQGKVFTTGQVAKICKVAPRTVSKWFDSKRLKGYKVPGSSDRRIPRAELIKFMTEYGLPLGDLGLDRRHKILCVGWNKADVEKMTTHLSSIYFRFLETQSIVECGMMLHEHDPETVLVDLQLGSRECKVLCGIVRRMDTRNETLRQIIATRLEDIETSELLGPEGFDTVMTNPLNFEDLAKIVETYGFSRGIDIS